MLNQTQHWTIHSQSAMVAEVVITAKVQSKRKQVGL